MTTLIRNKRPRTIAAILKECQADPLCGVRIRYVVVAWFERLCASFVNSVSQWWLSLS